MEREDVFRKYRSDRGYDNTVLYDHSQDNRLFRTAADAVDIDLSVIYRNIRYDDNDVSSPVKGFRTRSRLHCGARAAQHRIYHDTGIQPFGICQGKAPERSELLLLLS